MTTAYEELVSCLYDEEDRQNLEWAIGSALMGGPKKTVVIYGPAASGKTTTLKIIEKIFENQSVGVILDDVMAVEVRDEYLFIATHELLNFEELEAMPDVVLVKTSGRTHPQGLYERLIVEIYETDYELRLIAHESVRRFVGMGSTYFNHAIPDTLSEENDQ